MSLVSLGVRTQVARRPGALWGYTKAQTQALITEGYIPVATHQDLNSVRANQTNRVWAAGTEWETTKSSTGLADKYIQVADIDLYDECRTGGAYDNAGAGWIGIGTSVNRFEGIYDAGGFMIYGLYINSSHLKGLFSYIGANGRLRNLYLARVEMTWLNANNGLIAAYLTLGGIIEACYVDGKYQSLVTGNSNQGGVVGQNHGLIKNCLVSANGRGVGNNFAGITGYNNGAIKNCLIISDTESSGSGVGPIIGTVVVGSSMTDCYYDVNNLRFTTDDRGIPISTITLTNHSADIYDTWKTEVSELGDSVWKFQDGKYPILQIIGITPINVPAPKNLTITSQLATWNHSFGGERYNIYKVNASNGWEKVNSEPIINNEFAGTFDIEDNYYVEAITSARGFVLSSGASPTWQKERYLFSDAKMVFTHDDGLIDNYTVMYPILQSKGISATIYITSDWVGNADRVSWIQLKEMQDNGIDVQCHTKSHARLTDLDEQGIITELDGLNSAFTANNLTPAEHIAYPYGSYNDAVKTTVATRRATARTTSGGLIYDKQSYDKLALKKAYRGDNKGIEMLDEAKEMMLHAKHTKSILIADGHGVTPVPTEFSISSELFEAIVDYAQEIELDVITMSELSALLD